MSRPGRRDGERDGSRQRGRGRGRRGRSGAPGAGPGDDDEDPLVVALAAVAGGVVGAGVVAVLLGGSLARIVRAWTFLSLVAGVATFVPVRYRLYRRLGVFPAEARRVAAFGGLVAAGAVVGVGLLDWWALAGGERIGVVALVVLAGTLLGSSALARRGDPVVRCRVAVWTVGVGVALWSLGTGLELVGGVAVPSATPLAPAIGQWLAGTE